MSPDGAAPEVCAKALAMNTMDSPKSGSTGRAFVAPRCASGRCVRRGARRETVLQRAMASPAIGGPARGRRTARSGRQINRLF
jgi:hypothetical protein